MTHYESVLFHLDLVDGWSGERDEEGLHTFVGPSDIGALQITAFRFKESISDVALLDVTKLSEEERKYLGRVICGDFTGYQFIYAAEDIFWRKFWLSVDDVLLFVTYNCPRPQEDLELKDVNEIVSTFKRST